MPKKKIFIWGDAPIIHTGFGVVAANLFCDLYKNYSVDILGINNFGTKKYDQEKWFLYSVESSDPFGVRRLPTVIKESAPDLIILFQDIFHIDAVLKSVLSVSSNVPLICYYPIDGSPVNLSWKQVFTSKAIKKHFIYSEFAEREIKRTFQGAAPEMEILYHGVSPSYHLINDKDRAAIRKKLGFENRFIITNVNVYQPRKNIMATLLSVALLRWGYHKCSCGNYYALHEKECTLNKCGPEDIVDSVDPKDDVGLNLHMTGQNRAMGPLRSNILQSLALNCGWKDEDIQNRNLFLLPPDKNLAATPFTEEELNLVYNASNINLTTTCGEGFGLNLVEASITGTTTLAPDNSPISEILNGSGHLIRNAEFFTQGMDNSHLRPIVSISNTIDKLEIVYREWIDNDKKKVINRAAISNVSKRFQWADKREQLEKAIREILE